MVPTSKKSVNDEILGKIVGGRDNPKYVQKTGVSPDSVFDFSTSTMSSLPTVETEI